MSHLSKHPNLFPNPIISGLWCQSCGQTSPHALDLGTNSIACQICGWYKIDEITAPKPMNLKPTS